MYMQQVENDIHIMNILVFYKKQISSGTLYIDLHTVCVCVCASVCVSMCV